LETKIKISFQIRKSRLENNTLWKSKSRRDYCVPEKGVRNVVLYVPHFLKDIFVFLFLELGAVTWCRKQLPSNKIAKVK